jgi:hypothetical protein
LTVFRRVLFRSRTSAMMRSRVDIASE